MLKTKLVAFLAILFIFTLIFNSICVFANSSPIVYIHEGDYVIEITDGVTSGSAYTHNMMPVNIPYGKTFIGWYDADGNLTNTVNVSNEAHLFAKYRDSLNGDTVVDFSGISSKPELKGVTYIKDGYYNTSVNEAGWALSDWDSEIGGPVLGRNPNSSAYAWEPVEKKATTQVAKKHNGYLISTENKPVGTVMELGWGACSNHIIRDAEGYPITPKSNTQYAITITYEMLEEGNISLYLCGDRKISQIENGANAVSYSQYSSCYSSNVLDLKNTKAGVQYTYTFYINTSDFFDSVPMFSIHCRANSFMAQRVESAPGSDGNLYTSYDVGSSTYYPYKIVSTPKAVIKQVAINELEDGNVAMIYHDYDNEKGFSATVIDGGPYTVAPKVTNNSAVPNIWYKDEACQKIADTSVFSLNNVNYYSISYLASQKDNEINSKLYFDADEKIVQKDGQIIKAFNNLKTLLIGEAQNGYTYKLSFSVMAEKSEQDVSVEISTALSRNAATLKNFVAGNGFIIKKDEISSDGKTWYDMDYYFTADPLDTNADKNETGVNYHAVPNGATSVFMNVKNAGEGVYFTNITLTNLGEVLKTNGASVLNEEVQQQVGKQAIRFYFNYKTNSGNDIIIDNQVFKVIERGFIYRDGHLLGGEIENKNFNADAATVKTAKTSHLDNCWSYNENTKLMTFSTYVKDLKITDIRKTEVKAYIIMEDAKGKRHLIHSGTINRTIDGVKNGNVYDPTNRIMVWNEEFDYYDSVSQVNTFTQKYDTMISYTDNLKTSTSEDNYFIDTETGELILRVTSDGNKNYTTPKSVTTRDIMAYKYGYLEMRAKVPFLKGMWPSFWLQPDKSDWNTATYTGEIDIFEVSSETGFSSNLHKWYRKADGTVTNTAIGNNGHFLYGGLKYNFSSTSLANEYHLYGFEWTPEYMAFYVDNVLYCKIDITDKTGEYNKDVPGMDCFRNYYYICLNNWVFTEKQGNWMPDRAETLNDFAQNGVDYRIDYIRLYQNSSEELYVY